MSAVVALLMLIFAMGWSSVFLLRQLRENDRRLQGGLPDDDVRRLQEAIDDLGSRLTQLEEERDFYRELSAGDETRRLEPPGQ